MTTDRRPNGRATRRSGADGLTTRRSGADGLTGRLQRRRGRPRSPGRHRMGGAGSVLVVCYGILALAATGRSVFQILDRFGEAPVAFSLSALSAVVYIVATISLVAPGRATYRLAWVTITFELAGVIVIGTLSTFTPALLGLPDADPFGRTSTVWSVYGAGYLLVPLALPILGLLWLRKHPPRAEDAE